ncbi:hypothetical protein MYK68_08665 [Gordonia sp. PP30]|uniref:hypothetical protein n=1 Tax=unclassified Gordonia (in: high G+C Gram-positive bacteria) TaxID=2657482 RepID=UPI001FFFC761|nr:MULTISPECIES: hypothetical protein [unclassified Gordonia (in: high G+C Gram-positive bacteria)]UQE76613.1 hypothetical protein MYK68_08665 [Gordonia sp. PP30]
MNAQVWVTLILGVSATAGVLATLWQRQRSEERDRAQRAEYDSRSEWWKRYEWAVEQAYATDDRGRQLLGLDVLTELLDSSLATRSEWGVIRVLVMHPGIGQNGERRGH